MRLARVNRDPRLMGQLRDFISGLGGVDSVEINARTGSVLVRYQPEFRDNLQSVLANVTGADSFLEIPEPDLAANLEREARFLANHSELALQVIKSLKELNNGVRVATGNTVDLKVLLPAGLAVWAFFKTGVEAATPLWVTLGIFAFNSFVQLHRPAAERAR